MVTLPGVGKVDYDAQRDRFSLEYDPERLELVDIFAAVVLAGRKWAGNTGLACWSEGLARYRQLKKTIPINPFLVKIIPMLKFLPENGGNILGFRAQGTITLEDFDQTLAPCLTSRDPGLGQGPDASVPGGGF